MAIKKVITVCPYCASGCKIHLLVENNKIVGAEGANGKTNEGELCLKGYYGWDFVHDYKNPDSSPNSTDDPLQTW